MKRIKIMFTALAVLAVVGGALAFNAQKFSQACYYEDSVKHESADCPFIGVGATKTASGNVVFATTTLKIQGVDCPALSCPNKVRSIAE